MKCLLLALGLALACGIQGIDVPQSVQNMDLQKVGGRLGWGVSCRGAGQRELSYTSTNGPHDVGKPPPGSPSSGWLVTWFPKIQKVLGNSCDVHGRPTWVTQACYFKRGNRAAQCPVDGRGSSRAHGRPPQLDSAPGQGGRESPPWGRGPFPLPMAAQGPLPRWLGCGTPWPWLPATSPSWMPRTPL